MDQPGKRRRAKYQHYVPRLHLKQFVGARRMVWTYDNQTGQARPSKVSETGGETNFYSLKSADGSYYDELDQWLANVENAAAAPYRRLLNDQIPTGQARMDLATFVAALYGRAPSVLRAHAEAFAQHMQLRMDLEWRNPGAFNSSIDRLEAETGKKYDRQRLFEFWHDKERFWVEVSRKRGLPAMGGIDTLRDILFRREWYLIEAQRGYFITSDSPVVRYTDPSMNHPIFGDGGFTNPEAEVTVPLSPTKMLLITGQSFGSTSFGLAEEHVWTQNAARALFADRFLYAHRKDDRVTELASKHKDDRFRFQIGSGKRFAEVKITR